MNISQYVTLGAMDQLQQASGYDIMQHLERKKVNMWIGVKAGSIYHAIRQLEQAGLIRQIRKVQEGAYPSKTIYEITEAGRQHFDELQKEAFKGLFPSFYGFKLALKFNTRRSSEEIREFAVDALKQIDLTLKKMDTHLSQFHEESKEYRYDKLFIEHERLLFEAEKEWIGQVARELDWINAHVRERE